MSQKMVSGRSLAKLIKSPWQIFSTMVAGRDGRPPPGANPTLISEEYKFTAPGAKPERVPAVASPTNRKMNNNAWAT